MNELPQVFGQTTTERNIEKARIDAIKQTAIFEMAMGIKKAELKESGFSK